MIHAGAKAAMLWANLDALGFGWDTAQHAKQISEVLQPCLKH